MENYSIGTRKKIALTEILSIIGENGSSIMFLDTQSTLLALKSGAGVSLIIEETKTNIEAGNLFWVPRLVLWGMIMQTLLP